MRKIQILRSCVTDGEYIVESSFERKMSIDILCSILQDLKITNLRYSKELGVARFVLKNKEITLYATGKVSINGISNRRNAEVLVDRLMCIIQDAFIE